MKDRIITVFFVLVSLGLLSGCAGLLGIDRTFIDEMDREDESFFVADRDFRQIPGDNGKAYRSLEEIRSRTPASSYERKRIEHSRSMNKELVTIESKLHGNEYYRYQRAKSVLPTISEKLYYLNLAPRDRVKYIGIKGASYFDNSSMSTNSSVVIAANQSVVEKEITLGMSKGAVMGKWGRPNKIDVAGNPSFENERWTFYYRGNAKHIYFERGIVQGWTQ